MRVLFLILLMSTFVAGYAQEEEPEADEVNQEETEQAEPSPEADNLRSRRLGDAFKNFQPSEEISADNAVTFPVDI